ncbi:melanocyte-stimulating hormone receptor [Nematostella vectensis]|uniref:melanocyte-stimulating hormone receptor n=1 Tax=Nematostella vectensis TaxID=45351 RepID=UPI00207737DE|nr:melanocyte-stimulating hormone receptor [Nematostella vectensis]
MNSKPFLNGTQLNQSCLPSYLNGISLETAHGFSLVFCILQALFAAPAVVLNVIVMAGIIRTSSLHRPSYLMLGNLAVSDVGVGLLVMPFTALLEGAVSSGWESALCKLAYTRDLIGMFFVGSSFFNVALVSVDRLLALEFHLRYNALVTSKSASVALALTWVTAGLLTVSKIWSHKLFLQIQMILGPVILLMSTASNIRIYYIVRRHQRQIHRQVRSLTSSVANMSPRPNHVTYTCWIFGAFLICYFPYIAHILSRLLGFVDDILVFRFYTISLFLANTNSVGNPLLYCWRMRNVRRAMMNQLPVTWQKIMGGSNAIG